MGLKMNHAIFLIHSYLSRDDRMKKVCALFVFITLLSHMTLLSAHKDTQDTIEKPLVILITSYNNKDWYQKNLDAIFNQKYSNYRVIYVDDCSEDGTADLVDKYVNELNQQDRVSIIKNKTRHFKMNNLWHAVHMCQDNEIIIEYDGDDWFAHNQVLQRINDAYKSDIWLTYSNLVSWPNGKSGPNTTIPQDIIDTGKFRKFNGCFWSMLRTYYAWLAKEIALKDLLYEGQFMTRTSDVAIMFPMIEMAGDRFKYIQEPLYIYNVQTALNDSKVSPVLQKRLELLLRRKPCYPKVTSFHLHKEYEQAKSDMIIFTHNRPEKLALFLESIRSQMQGLDSIYLYIRSYNSDSYAKIIDAFNKKKSPQIQMYTIRQDHESLLTALDNSKNCYIVIANEYDCVIDSIEIPQCIKELEKTKAYGFYMTLPNPRTVSGTTPFIEIDENIVAWQFAFGKDRWAHPLSSSLTLYKKEKIIDAIKKLEQNNLDQLALLECQSTAADDDIGLCFCTPKALDTHLLMDIIAGQSGTFRFINW